MIDITFLGAAETVTGSKYLVKSGSARVLVDAGLFQGLKELRLRNWQDLPMPARELDAIVLTHAHLDHCGYLPRLIAQGFRGRIFCTAGTKDLCGIVLPDAGRIQEEDADHANRHGYSKHEPALPLYREVDAFRAVSQLQPCGYDRPMPVADGIEVEFINAGHLLGSSYVRMRVDGRTVLFGGDLGRFGRPILPDPTMVAEADYLLVESTYGDRVHEEDDHEDHLARVVNDTAAQKGKLIVPAFAIGRVEELLYWLRQLEDEKRIPVLPVYLDSPMAIAARAVYAARVQELDPDMQPEQHDDVAPHDAAAATPDVGSRQRRARQERQMCVFCTERLRTIDSPRESKALTASSEPSIVISSSGMAEGGRVVHHLEAALPHANNTVLFCGYQAAGTRGRRLLDGEKQIKMYGRWVPVAARIERLESMSAHADANEIMRWLGGFARPPQRTFIVHGEPPAMHALQQRIGSELHWTPYIPKYLETVTL
ncbi:MAG TPA: MBL fold metallo-hydrolase [Vicinamibacterales bacterium]|nr:MBL fold metallo-hydrolase [Vicinamibacterales bacterium]